MTSTQLLPSRPRTRHDGAHGLLRPWLVFAIAWLAVFLVCAAWSVASPLSSGPDESGHVMKAAASARGIWTGTPTGMQGITSFRLPADVADVGSPMTCFAGNPDQTAACAPSLDDASGRIVTVRSGVGDYNPAYYAFVGWPSLVTSGTASYIGMRLMSALVNSFFVALVFLVAAWMPRRRAFAGFIGVALTPMVLYLGGLVNPNGLEIAACAALAALTWSVVHDPDGPRFGLRMALLSAAGVAAGTMRSTSPVFVLGILVAVLLTVPIPRVVELVRRRSVWIAAIVSVVLLVPAVLWTVRVAAPAGFIPSADPSRPHLDEAFWHTLLSTGDYGTQMIGVLGWLDTHLSQGVLVGWTAALGFVVLGALLVGRRRVLIAPVVLMAAVLLAPAVLQAPSAPTYGYIWQGRYALPLLVAMVVVCGFVVDEYVLRPETGPRLVPIVWTLAVIAQVSAFLTAYRRYSVGENGSWRVMVRDGAWNAPGGFLPVFGMFLVGMLVLAALAVLLARRTVPDPVTPAVGIPAVETSAVGTSVVDAPVVGTPVVDTAR